MIDSEKPSFKRVTVAINASQASAHSLTTAVELAGLKKAQVEALFIEEVELLRLSELPFATELDKMSGNERVLNRSDITFSMRDRAKNLRDKLKMLGKGRKIKTRLRVVRGNYVAEAMQSKFDVLFMVPPRFQSLVRPYAMREFIRKPMRRSENTPIYAYFQGGEQSERTIRLASQLAAISGNELVVMLTPKQALLIQELKEKLTQIESTTTRVRYELVEKGTGLCVSSILQTGCSLIVLPKDVIETGLIGMDDLEKIYCPLVLIA